MNLPGNRTDEAIDKVFASLRSAELPAGMEDRILRRLEMGSLEARAVRPRFGWLKAAYAWMWKPAPMMYIAGSLALASLLVVIGFSLWLQRSQAAPQQVAAAPIASNSPHRSIIPAPPSAYRAPVRGVHEVKASSAPQSHPLSDENALALSEMLAPSKPAPPLPLTHQEEMLAAVVHRAEPEELASLRPDVRAMQMEISKAEFHDFFEPPPAKDSE